MHYHIRWTVGGNTHSQGKQFDLLECQVIVLLGLPASYSREYQLFSQTILSVTKYKLVDTW